jgi:hypothetical protein
MTEPAEFKSEDEKRNYEIVRHATLAFVQFRRELTKIVSPELGLIDDLALTWQARYSSKREAEEEDKIGKTGRLHLVLHTKTIPEPVTCKQIFNSFSIDSTVSLDGDAHPAAAEEEKEKKRGMSPAPAAATAADDAEEKMESLD